MRRTAEGNFKSRETIPHDDSQASPSCVQAGNRARPCIPKFGLRELTLMPV